MKLWVVSTLKDSPGTELVIKAAKQAGHDVRRLHPLKVGMWVGKDPSLGYMEDGRFLEPPDLIFTRMGAAAPIRAFLVLRIALHLPVPVINHPDALMIARNKVLTGQVLAGVGLPVPDTLILGEEQGSAEVLAALGEGPWVLKEAVGSKGAGVFLISDAEELDRRLKEVPESGGGWLVQRFLADAGGADIRVFLINGEARAAMKRQGKPGDFRSNLHLGGQGTPYELDAELREISERAARAIGLDTAGVDVVVTRDGYKILEVNGSPGFSGITGALGRNLAGELIEHLESLV
ncbi:MAG: RimK family alpha-L-glutamate ligase [Planctomycetota bacterium]